MSDGKIFIYDVSRRSISALKSQVTKPYNTRIDIGLSAIGGERVIRLSRTLVKDAKSEIYLRQDPFQI